MRLTRPPCASAGPAPPPAVQHAGRSVCGQAPSEEREDRLCWPSPRTSRLPCSEHRSLSSSPCYCRAPPIPPGGHSPRSLGPLSAIPVLTAAVHLGPLWRRGRGWAGLPEEALSQSCCYWRCTLSLSSECSGNTTPTVVRPAGKAGLELRELDLSGGSLPLTVRLLPRDSAAGQTQAVL